MNKSLLLSLAVALIAGPAAAGTRHHHAKIEGAFGFSGLYQPVVLNLDFDMDEETGTGDQRMITNVTFTLDLLPGGGVANTAYTMKSTGLPGRSYADVTRIKEGYDFSFEVPSYVDVGALGSGLQWCVRRTDRGTYYGTDAKLVMWPRCNADLTSCTLGVLGGVSTGPVIPEYKIEASNRFSMAARD